MSRLRPMSRLVLAIAPLAVLASCTAAAGFTVSAGDAIVSDAPDPTTVDPATTAPPLTSPPDDPSTTTTVVTLPLPPVQVPVPLPIMGTTVPAGPTDKPSPPTSDPGLATPVTARSNANCQAIEAEFLLQGAEPDVADQFAYVIAPRESGCTPQLVSTATDLSYSRLGLNFIGSMPVYWGRLCGVTDYHATAELSVDVRCGLAAYRALGWKPWS